MKLFNMLYCLIFSHKIHDKQIELMELVNDSINTRCLRCNGLIKIWKDYDCKEGEYWEKEI